MSHRSMREAVVFEPSYYTCEKGDITYDGARSIVEEERRHIERWRGRTPRFGLALSGGGMRSASFCLGVLQAFAKRDRLQQFDYMSTVSGGGFIGASITYLLHQSARARARLAETRWPEFDASRENFPYISNPMVSALPDNADTTHSKGWLLRRLRQTAKYLAPGKGITVLSLFGVVLRNCLLSVLVHAALLTLVLELVFLPGRFHWPVLEGHQNWALWPAACFFALFGLISVMYALASTGFEHLPDRHSYRLRRWFEVATHWLMTAGLLSLMIGILPWVDSKLIELSELSRNPPAWLKWVSAPGRLGTISAILGLLGNILGFKQTRSGRKPRVAVAPLVLISSGLLLFGMLLVLFHYVVADHDLSASLVMLISCGVLVVFGWLPDINYLSIHRYYRDRLMETFMPDPEISVPGGEERTGLSRSGNETVLGSLCGANSNEVDAPTSTTVSPLARGPYHIINANIVLVSSKIPRYRGRGGDNFILSPLFTGSRATGWEKTSPSQTSGISLATAMAISGAAISPNAGVGGLGVTRQPILSVLMGLFNIRMGYWLANPNPSTWESWSSLLRDTPAKEAAHPRLINPGLYESFGRMNLREGSRYVLLSDGGHFENLGLYELVRRRLKVIVVCDGTADPNYTFSDLANAIEKVRADFGALIEISPEELRSMVPTRDKSRAAKGSVMSVAERGYFVAKIRYATRQDDHGSAKASHSMETGCLIYLNTTFFQGLSADLQGYRREHPLFPDQPTSNQFFDEREFEAYRELGYQTAWRMFEELGVREPDTGADSDASAWLKEFLLSEAPPALPLFEPAGFAFADSSLMVEGDIGSGR